MSTSGTHPNIVIKDITFEIVIGLTKITFNSISHVLNSVYPFECYINLSGDSVWPPLLCDKDYSSYSSKPPFTITKGTAGSVKQPHPWEATVQSITKYQMRSKHRIEHNECAEDM